MASTSANTDSKRKTQSDSTPIIKHPKFFFDNTLVVIQIENVQFNVHKYQLIKSETFADMFAIAEKSKIEGQPLEGSSTDNPIKMEGVSATDFECLLTVLYATHFSTHQPEPEASLIIPAFRLANMWNFSDLRAYLMPLAEKVLGDVDKITFAREFHVDKWIVPAYTRICQRNEPLNGEEATKIGLEGVLLISRIREEIYKDPASGTQQCRYCNYTSGYWNSTTVSCNSCGRSWTWGTAKLSDEDIGKKINTWVQDGHIFTK